MAKLSKRLEEMRNPLILQLFNTDATVEDIAEIFGLTTSSIYNILKGLKDEE